MQICVYDPAFCVTTSPQFSFALLIIWTCDMTSLEAEKRMWMIGAVLIVDAFLLVLPFLLNQCWTGKHLKSPVNTFSPFISIWFHIQVLLFYGSKTWTNDCLSSFPHLSWTSEASWIITCYCFFNILQRNAVLGGKKCYSHILAYVLCISLHLNIEVHSVFLVFHSDKKAKSMVNQNVCY